MPELGHWRLGVSINGLRLGLFEMTRWIFALLLAAQASTAFAADNCGGARVTSGRAEMLVIVEQEGIQEPATTHVGLTGASIDDRLRFNVGYSFGPDGRMAPHTFWVDVAATAPSSIDAHPETIKWRRDGGEWKTYPNPIYAGNDGRFSFHIAQRGPAGWRGLTYGAEHLDELKHGGPYEVMRVSKSGEEQASGSFDYPDETALSALYAEARAKAVADLSPCKPPLLIHPAGS